MCSGSLYVKYNIWRDEVIEKLTTMYEDEEITEDEYIEALGNLTFDDFIGQNADREE